MEVRLLSRLRPGQHTSGSAGTFKREREAFEAAWRELLPTRTEADFPAWRDDHAWHERKQAMWARGEKLPSQQPSSFALSMRRDV
jgi:hypothetical protein